MDFSSYLIKLSMPVEFEFDAYHTCDHVPFFKYQGCGNDFIMLDNTDGLFNEHLHNVALIRNMCDRHYGAGADGLIVISRRAHVHYEMLYYNSDGRVGSVCGNGARCGLAFAAYLGLYDSDGEATFMACDGVHRGRIVDQSRNLYQVNMGDVDRVRVIDECSYFVDTGSPHHVVFVEDDLNCYAVRDKGREIRHSAEYTAVGGTNVNFVQSSGIERVRCRTYERGVEDETLACGTGAVAVAIITYLRQASHSPSAHVTNKPVKCSQTVQTRGGDLQVTFTLTMSQTLHNSWNNIQIRDINLTGPAKPVYHGIFTWKNKFDDISEK